VWTNRYGVESGEDCDEFFADLFALALPLRVKDAAREVTGQPGRSFPVREFLPLRFVSLWRFVQICIDPLEHWNIIAAAEAGLYAEDPMEIYQF
jgi:hypothetical protein